MEARVLGYVGPPGSGKTQLALAHLLALHRAGVPCYVCDVMGDLPDKLHDGTPLPLSVSPSIMRLALRRGIGRYRPDWIHVVRGRQEAALLAYAMGRYPRPNRPAAVLIDEMGQWQKEAGRHRLGLELGDYLAGRRHTGVTLLWGAQFPRQVHYSLISQTNYLHAFGMADRSDLGRLHDGGVNDDTLKEIAAVAAKDKEREESGQPVSHMHLPIRIIGGGLPAPIDKPVK